MFHICPFSSLPATSVPAQALVSACLHYGHSLPIGLPAFGLSPLEYIFYTIPESSSRNTSLICHSLFWYLWCLPSAYGTTASWLSMTVRTLTIWAQCPSLLLPSISPASQSRNAPCPLCALTWFLSFPSLHQNLTSFSNASLAEKSFPISLAWTHLPYPYFADTFLLFDKGLRGNTSFFLNSPMTWAK